MTVAIAKSPSLQASLIEALSSADPERALEHSFIQLARGGDLPLLLAMLKALVRAGLAGIAVQLLHAAGGVLATEPQLAALAEQLSSLPSGEIDAEVLQTRCRKAASIVTQDRPHLKEHLIDAAACVRQFRVFQSIKGNTHIVAGSTSRNLEFIMPFVDQVALADAMALPPITLTSSFLFVGVPSPILWQRIVNTREASGFVPSIDVVEPDSTLLTAWLGLIDNPSVFEGDRVCMFTGADAVADYRNFLIEHPWRTPATHSLTNHRPRWNPPVIDRAFSDSVTNQREKRSRRAKQCMHDRHAGRDAAWWRERFRTAATSGPPLRVVGLTTRFSTVIQHSMRDLAAAFKRHGCEFDLVMQPSSSCANVDVVGTLAAKDYDLIVVINHLRFEFDASMPSNVPYLCWIQDHMDQLSDRRAGKSVGRLDLVVGHAPDVMESLYGYPRDRFLPSSNLTDPSVYDDAPAAESDLDPFRCDVSYAGHGADTPDRLLEQITEGAPSSFSTYLRMFLVRMSDRLGAKGWLTPQELFGLLLEAERDSGHPPIPPVMRRARVYPQAARLYDRAFRHQALQWVSRWSASRGCRFNLYGRGWNTHPTLATHCRGEVTPGHETRCLYQASSVNLQINGYGSLHQRLLDAVAAGGFVAARYNPADFLRRPLRMIQQAIESNRVSSLSELLRIAEDNTALRNAIDGTAAMSGILIAPLDDPARQDWIRVSRATNGVPDLETDEGLFAALRDMRFVPHRTAGDLPGFEGFTFRDQASLETLLEACLSDPEAKASTMRLMRKEVLTHDTYDALVSRVIDAFADSPEAALQTGKV